MGRSVFCVVLKKEAEGLEEPPYPGELGQRIYTQVSKEGWQRCLVRLAAIINEARASTLEAESIELLEKHIKGFLFGEGEFGRAPPGFNPRQE